MDDLDSVTERISQKTDARMQNGRDPKFAKWQEVLETELEKIRDRLVPGEIISADTLSPDDDTQYRKLRATMDLAPFVSAVFFPPSEAVSLNPPSSGKTVERAAVGSCKILVTRLNSFDRILTAEISSKKPGIDILDDGSLLGCYNYGTPAECISDLSKIVWIHLKHQDAWTQEDYITYTERWFYRSARNRMANLPINVNHSYIHHPVLINLNTVKAVCRLMKMTMSRLSREFEDVISMVNASNLYNSETVQISAEGVTADDEEQLNSLRIYLEERLLGLLKWLRGYDIVNFAGFSSAEQRDFKHRFNRVVDEIYEEVLEGIRRNQSADITAGS